jgi:hypothetical protein
MGWGVAPLVKALVLILIDENKNEFSIPQKHLLRFITQTIDDLTNVMSMSGNLSPSLRNICSHESVDIMLRLEPFLNTLLNSKSNYIQERTIKEAAESLGKLV